MQTLQANRNYPNTGGWQDRHDAAILQPKTTEFGIVYLMKGLVLYAEAHKHRYDSLIGDDGVLGAEFEAVALGIRGLLNGETGRLDCGTLDGAILDLLKTNGFDTENL